MTLKRQLTRIALVCGLAAMSAGILPAPTCPTCRTMDQFNAYMEKLAHPKPTIFSTLRSFLLGWI